MSTGADAPLTPRRPRLLFIDDEAGVLDGLRNLLRKERHCWEMAFVVDPTDAAERVQATPFDVVVTDLRMPRMDGAQLLGIVREHTPATVRIVLSGQAELEVVARADDVADLSLSKPCDAAALRAALYDAVALAAARAAAGRPG
jgi:YesN/AraC family two-component response regulator